jgi:hypothetical protein
MNEEIVKQYEELKVLIETLQNDVVKNAQGNKSAGVRTRKALREVKKAAADLVKCSLTFDKGE